MSEVLFFAGLDNDLQYFKISKILNDGKEMFSIDISNCIYEKYDNIYRAINKMMEYKYMLNSTFERYCNDDEELIDPSSFFNACFITTTKYNNFIRDFLANKGFIFVKCALICPEEQTLFMITYEIYDKYKIILELEKIL